MSDEYNTCSFLTSFGNQTIGLPKWNLHFFNLLAGGTSRKLRPVKEHRIAATVHVFLERGARQPLYGPCGPASYTHGFLVDGITLLEGENLIVVQVKI